MEGRQFLEPGEILEPPLPVFARHFELLVSRFFFSPPPDSRLPTPGSWLLAPGSQLLPPNYLAEADKLGTPLALLRWRGMLFGVMLHIRHDSCISLITIEIGECMKSKKPRPHKFIVLEEAPLREG